MKLSHQDSVAYALEAVMDLDLRAEVTGTTLTETPDSDVVLVSFDDGSSREFTVCLIGGAVIVTGLS